MAQLTLFYAFLAFLLKSGEAQSDEEYSPFDSFIPRDKNFTDAVLWYQDFVCLEFCDTIQRTAQACAICNSDRDCWKFGDCCPDVTLREPNMTTSDVTLTCPTIPGSNDSYYMVTSCPRDQAETEAGRKCSHLDARDWRQELPVSDTNVTKGQLQVTYRNRYCAQCHGVTSPSPWQLSIDCSQGDPEVLTRATSADDMYRLARDSGKCQVSVRPSSQRTRACTPAPSQPIISQCNVTGQWRNFDKRIARACAAYQNVFFGTYRNAFCFLCNSNDSWMACPGYGGLPPIAPGVSGSNFVSITFILDLRDDQEAESSSHNVSENACNSTSILHPHTCDCLPLHCAVGKYVTSDGCKSVSTMTTSYGYDVSFEVSLTMPASEASLLEENYHDCMSSLRSSLERDWQFKVKKGQQRVLSLSCTKTELTLRVASWNRIFPVALLDREETERKLLGVFDGEEVNGTDSLYRYRLKLSERDSLPEMGAIPVSITGCSNVVMPMLALPRDGDTEPYVSPQFYQVSEEALYLPLSPLLTCRQVELSPRDFSYSNQSGFLHVRATNVTLRYPHFQLIGSSARVCEEHLNASMTGESTCLSQGPSSWSVVGVLSLVCTVISLVFLALTLATYLLFRELRTTSGICNMGMMVVLFLALATFQFGTAKTEVAGLCVVMGVLAHYLWLSATFWMNACTFLMFYKLMFPLTARVILSSRRKVFARAALYAFLLPAAIVAGSLGANYGLHGNPGYGGDRNCYIRDVNTRRFAVALPIGSLVVANLVLFVWTVVHLRRGCRVSSSKESKVGLFACAKLSVITGLNWLLLFLHEAVRQTGVEYLATSVVGLYGVVLFLALVLNRHVLGLFRARFLGSKESRSKTSSDDTRLTHGSGSGGGGGGTTEVTNRDTHL